MPTRRSEMASATRRKLGPPPQPPELRKTRKVGLTEAAFAKVPALRGSAWHRHGSDVAALAVDLADRVTAFRGKATRLASILDART